MSRNPQERERTLAAICIDLSLKDSYEEILRYGTLKTCYVDIPEDFDLFIYHSNKPNSFWKQFDFLIENFRWKKGRIAAYSISYVLMFLLFPLRPFLPSITESYEVKFAPSNAKVLHVKFPEARAFQRWKKLALLKKVLKESKANWFVLTTPSYYVNLGQLRLLLKKLKLSASSPFYGGTVNSSADGIYVSGGWTLINRDAAERLIANRIHIPVHSMDDIAFGVLMQKENISCIEIPESKFLSNRTDGSNFLFREIYFRLSSVDSDGNRKDLQHFQHIHEVLVKQRNSTYT